MKNLVIGMAGHIDHGKTTLIKKLTGIDTDTLIDEKKRGMTIDIGFAQIDFGEGRFASIVDVPGHEKFIKNMSAGISNVDFLVMVIACDDGIMPQTKEHFEIAKLFGIKHGMIVLTKQDMVSKARCDEVKKQCEEFFKGSFLEDAKTVFTHCDDNKTYENLKSVLCSELEKIETSDRGSHFFRLDIDRVFTVQGFGTVVTGTVKNGAVNLGDTLRIYPQNKEVRVKNIESHNTKKESLSYGNRCAINIGGIDKLDKKDISRGDVLSSNIASGKILDCKLNLIEGNFKVKNGAKIRVNIGTTEKIGKILILGKNQILGKESAYIKIFLEEEISANIGDLGIVRDFSPINLLGGIEVLYIDDKEKDIKKINRKDRGYLEFLENMSDYDILKKIETLIKKEIEIEKISALVGKNIENELGVLENQKIYRLDKKYIHLENISKILEEICKKLKEIYEKNHLARGILKNLVRDEFFKNFTLKDFNAFLELDIVKEKILIKDEYITLAKYKIKLDKKEKFLKEEIFSYYKDQKFEIYSTDVYREKTKYLDIFDDILNYMTTEKFIIYLDEKRYILKGYMNESIKIISDFIEKNGEISVRETRELLNNSRDSAILILRKMDSLGITKNVEGKRILVNNKKIG